MCELRVLPSLLWAGPAAERAPASPLEAGPAAPRAASGLCSDPGPLFQFLPPSQGSHLGQRTSKELQSAPPLPLCPLSPLSANTVSFLCFYSGRSRPSLIKGLPLDSVRQDPQSQGSPHSRLLCSKDSSALENGNAPQGKSPEMQNPSWERGAEPPLALPPAFKPQLPRPTGESGLIRFLPNGGRFTSRGI